jgi:ABC-type branched-subunit amino acid transport system ATPase component
MVLANISGGISNGEKIGLIGSNGIGKTTLSRILAGAAPRIRAVNDLQEVYGFTAREVEGEFLGRVFGVWADFQCSHAADYAGVWTTADVIKVEWLLIGTGFLMVAESLFMFRNRMLIQAGKQF